MNRQPERRHYDWREDRMCLQIDPILWETKELIHEAKQACALCPVLALCRREVISAPPGLSTDGTVVAGMTFRVVERARAEYRRKVRARQQAASEETSVAA